MPYGRQSPGNGNQDKIRSNRDKTDNRQCDLGKQCNFGSHGRCDRPAISFAVP